MYNLWLIKYTIAGKVNIYIIHTFSGTVKLINLNSKRDSVEKFEQMHINNNTA